MQTQQTILQTRGTDPSSSPDPDTAASEALASCRRMTEAADAAIEQAYSGDAETFLAANRQCGGQ